jgi:Flp pilus assembly protein TadG
MNGLYRRIREERGAAIVLVALTMVAMLSAVALAVDVGMLVTARTEAQRVGDAAALAGAGILRDSNGDSAQAHNKAVEFASTRNTVQGSYIAIANSDVQVIPAEWTVRVQVRNAQPTFFARIFGISAVNIATNSAAWAAKSTTIGSDDDTSCPALPLALLDKYVETNGDSGWQPGEEILGWTDEDHGKLLRLKQKPKPKVVDESPYVLNDLDYCRDTGNDSSWRCWWRHPTEEPNVGHVVDKINGDNCITPLTEGNDVNNASGNMQAAVEAFRQLIINDPDDLSWCPECGGGEGCVVAAAESSTCFTGENKRLRTVPTIDPPSTIEGDDNGSNIDGVVTGFVGVFVENASETWNGDPNTGSPGQRNAYLRIVQQAGTNVGDPDGENDPEATVRTLQLIE